MIDYSIYYRRSINPERIKYELDRYDLFISAFNLSDRVGKVFSEIKAERKVWFIQQEYKFSPIELPVGNPISQAHSISETNQINKLLSDIGDMNGKKICIDITGFMRHTLSFLTAKLKNLGIQEFTALYSEPLFYKKQENTTFTNETSGTVRAIHGMSGSTNHNGQDYLLMAVGYDNKLINEVINYKDGSKIYPIFAFPSLSADMFQQSAIRTAKSGDVALDPKNWIANRCFAPANDPFSTASTISKIVNAIDRQHQKANIYLSPLSTKVQTLGISLYWLLEGDNRGAVSIILPECVSYASETSEGLKRIWSYTIELN